MKVSELMKDYTPKADFEGFVTADDMVLAIDISETQKANIDDYEVLQLGIEGIDPSLNSETIDKQYLRSGKSSQKTSTQRKFAINGDRYIGDPAQDHLLAHKMKYATGQGAVLPYVFFNVLTGAGEKGTATVAVNNDGSGNSGESASISIEMSKIGAAPKAFTYGEEVNNEAEQSSIVSEEE